MSYIRCTILDYRYHFAVLSAPTFVCDEPPAFGSGEIMWERWFSFGKNIFSNLSSFKKKSEMQSDWLGKSQHDFI